MIKIFKIINFELLHVVISSPPVILCMLMILSIELSSAQTPISLQAAIDTALKNNLSVRSERLEAEYYHKLTSSIEIPQTTISGEYGQINSAYKDTRFGISQSISFPTIYARQKTVQKGNYKNGLLNIELKEAELRKQVSEVFYRIIFLHQKEALLLKNDSLYADFIEKSSLRFAVGETDILEKITSETQRGQISIQLKQLEQDIDVEQLQFQWLLNKESLYQPLVENPKLFLSTGSDTSTINQHPSMKVLQQYKDLTIANTLLEKSRLLPNLNFSYNNMSIQGIGADNLTYPKSTRFSSVQFGVGVPLFFSSQKAKIKSSRTLEAIAENKLQQGLHTLKLEYEKVFKQYFTQLQTVQYYEKTALPNAKKLRAASGEQLSIGEINYLEWIMLINNALSIESAYADSLKELNQSIIQLNYLNTK